VTVAKQDGKESFEELYRWLEETVEKLERGGLPLEQSIALYERGMELAKRCQAMLDQAELRITKLRESFGQAAPPSESAPGNDELVAADELFPADEE